MIIRVGGGAVCVRSAAAAVQRCIWTKATQNKILVSQAYIYSVKNDAGMRL